VSRGGEPAQRNRALFGQHKLLAVNLIGSPGCGKTSLLEATLKRLSMRAAVIEGDIKTDFDSRRIRATGTPAVQIETHGACHLDAAMVERAAAQLPLGSIDVLFIENVGNLVCPSGADLGEDMKVAVLSVPEGDEKPAKYPALFVRASAVIINKTDLLPYVEYSLERAATDCRKLNGKVTLLPLSCRTGEGIEAWVKFVEAAVRRKKAK
jgi:hydrogenase nickel incorporation protein HypB